MGLFDFGGGKETDEQWKEKSSWGKYMDGYMDSRTKIVWDSKKMKNPNYIYGFWEGYDDLQKEQSKNGGATGCCVVVMAVAAVACAVIGGVV